MNFDSTPHPARMAHFVREMRESRGPGEQRTPSARAEYFAAKGRTAVEPGTVSGAWVRASDLSPRDPEFARRAATSLQADGQADAARDFAQRALTNHDNSRLDPLRQLSEREVEALRAILR